MGGYDFMIVLWVIFIIVGLLRIKDDYKDFRETKERLSELDKSKEEISPLLKECGYGELGYEK